MVLLKVLELQEKVIHQDGSLLLLYNVMDVYVMSKL